MPGHYSIPQEAKKLLFEELVNNKLHASAPSEINEAAEYIQFIGTDLPVIPINWRFAESISAIKGFEGAMLNVLLKRRYEIEYQKIVINSSVKLLLSSFAPRADAR